MSVIIGPAATQILVVKFDGGICGGILVEHASDYFPAKEARKSSSKLRRKFATSFAETFANFTLEVAGAYNQCSGQRIPPELRTVTVIGYNDSSILWEFRLVL